MRKDLLSKALVMGVVVLFIGVGVAGSSPSLSMSESQKFKIEGNTLYVGGSGEGNYTTIQSAIDDAVDGDTVFVYDDSSPYYEELVIDKSINLIGEDRASTVIDGCESDIVIDIIVDGVTISCFTVQDCGGWDEGANINIRANSAIINENIIRNSDFDGISLIRISDSNNIRIIHNDIYSGGICGIFAIHVDNLLIFGNTFLHTFFLACDIMLYDTECIIKRNTFNSVHNGLYLYDCSNCIVTENNFVKEYFWVTFMYFFPQNPWNSNNNFNYNYWYEPRDTPKLLKGVIMPSNPILFEIFFVFCGILGILPPCFHFDWYPSKEPFDITTTQECGIK